MSNRSTADLPPDGGFALPVVLWTVALLALLTTRGAATGRTEAQLAGSLRDAVTADAMADGATHEAVFCFPAVGVGRLPAAGASACRMRQWG